MQQYTLRKGTRMVVITEDMGRVSARLYLNNGDTAARETWTGKTKVGAEYWAKRVLSPQ